jgi:hypothetical protein
MNFADGELPIKEDGTLCFNRFKNPILLVIKGEEFLVAVVDGAPFVYKSTIDLLRLVRISGLRIQLDSPISLIPDDYKFKEIR